LRKYLQKQKSKDANSAPVDGLCSIGAKVFGVNPTITGPRWKRAGRGGFSLRWVSPRDFARVNSGVGVTERALSAQRFDATQCDN